jgi:hypothetical protein
MAHKRRLHIRAVRRKDIDLRKLSRALIELAAAQAETDAAAAHQAQSSARSQRKDGRR